MFIILYLAISLVILFTEARDCYKEKAKIDFSSLIFALLWPVSLPFAIIVVWKDNKNA